MKKTFTLLFIVIFTVTFTVIKSTAQITDLNAIKALYNEANVTLPSATINGVVISDTVNGNLSAANTIVQANGTGIILYFGKGAGHYYTMGDSISLDITGFTLTKYDSALEIDVPSTAIINPPIVSGVKVTPQVVTLSQLNNNINALSYTLVEVIDATATTTAGIFSGAQTLADASGSIELYTGTKSTFADSFPPVSAANWVGYAELYKTTPEFLIRNLNDILPYFPLPLKFVTFSTEVKGLISVLSWSTANEVNTSKFVIEKSFDGNNFASVGALSANENKYNNYTFSDAGNKSGTTVYYRIKSVDKDGTYTYSTIQKATFATTSVLSVYPNPAYATTKLVYPAIANDVLARLLSNNGKLVKQFILKAGTNSIDIDVSTLAKGIYYLEINNGNKTTVSFLKK